VLGNFPRLNRLQNLFLNNNRISKIDGSIHEFLPNLKTIILTNNALSELGDLEPLIQCKKLTHLSVMDNPVAKKPHYRLYIIYKLPQVRVLDFNKVKLAERTEAAALFAKEDGTDNDLAKSITDNKTKTFEPGEGLDQGGVSHGLTPDEQMKIKVSRICLYFSLSHLTRLMFWSIQEALKQATSLDEISRLERLLKAGHVPSTKKGPEGDN
jgi:U2 small nuclear ribonucleoprotein A'